MNESKIPISEHQLDIRIARNNLLDFTTFTKHDYEVNWHHAKLCHYLDKFIAGEIKRLLVFMPVRTGKQIADSTIILTTKGWRKHGGLKVNDYVFGSDGKPTKIIALSPKSVSKMKVIFGDGEEILCHENHEWKVYDRKDKKIKLLETKEIFENFSKMDIFKKEAVGRFLILTEPYGVPKNYSFYKVKDFTTELKELPKFGFLAGTRIIKNVKHLIYSKEQGNCIQVDNKDGLYLVGKKLIPTHNSELVSRRLPAFLFGKDPNASIISTSYGATLASRMNRDVQRIIESKEYQQLFPDTKLFGKNVQTLADGTYLKNSEIFEIVDHKGYYISAGIGGAITGSGGKYLLCDDPIKNRKEANSKTYREAIWEWYGSTFYTRQEKDASILITQTRWHEDDMSGRLLEKSLSDEDADQWTVINFPAIKDQEDPYIRFQPEGFEDPREDGEALWENKYSRKKLKAIRASISSKDWNSIFQQRPKPDKGDIIHREWYRFYRVVPGDLETITLSWDMNFKESVNSSFVEGQVWGKKGANRYLLDEFREQVGFVQTIKAMISFNKKWDKLSRVILKNSDSSFIRENIVEEKANGSAVIDTLKTKIPGLIPYNPTESKEARMNAVAPQIAAGNVFLPDPNVDHEHTDMDVHDFIEETVGFPSAKFSDRCDAMSQLLIRLRETTWLDILESDEDENDSGMSDDLKELFWGDKF